MTSKLLAVPIYNEKSKHQFANSEDVSPFTVVNAGIELTTAPLLFGKEISLLGISDSLELQEQGITDFTDSLSTSASIESVFVKLPTNEVVEVKLSSRNKFSSLAGNPRKLMLSTTIEYRTPAGYDIYFRLSGELDTELGNIVVHVSSANTELVFLGYTPEIERINHNRRNRNL